ncbi:MAG: helix-turn-helix domain-containing protein [Alphaproteobacteria bacterium]|nr:helix-turn-helix domain-containing protein [Alphaproteobacteria bacterium]
MSNLKERLEFYMTKAGLNPTSLSRKARLNITAVRDILQHPGNPNPRIDTFIKLCEALGIGAHQLSPQFERLFSPRQRELLDGISELDEKDSQMRKEIAKEKNNRESA